MAISVDASRAFLLPSQLQRLAAAVRDAGEHDESSWIERKNTLPLGTDQARVHLVKHLLGFANRSPEVAARWAEGHGYLLVGVSPGEVRGVTSIDHNDMEQDLKPYIGPDLLWSPEYVELDGRSVLVVVVAPPKPGDPIHSLRKPLPHPRGNGFVHSEHTAFVRRNAQTVKAEPEEWRRLHLRFAATQSRLDVEVVTSQQRIERRADFPERTGALLEPHRQWLLHGRYQRLCLQLVNRVDRPFPGVKVTLTVRADGQLDCPSEKYPFAVPPRPPRPYGTPFDLAAEEAFLCDVDLDLASHDDEPGAGGFWSEEMGQANRLRIAFSPVDLRPRETLQMPRVPLVVSADVDTVLTVEWSAAGLGADGQENGRLTLAVTASTLTPLTGDDVGTALGRALGLRQNPESQPKIGSMRLFGFCGLPVTASRTWSGGR